LSLTPPLPFTAAHAENPFVARPKKADSFQRSIFLAAVLGSFWGKEISRAEREGRIGKVDTDPSLPVHKAWDIGVDDPMAIWCFQLGPGVINVVDYYEASG
jgi:hypothetical protein